MNGRGSEQCQTAACRPNLRLPRITTSTPKNLTAAGNCRRPFVEVKANWPNSRYRRGKVLLIIIHPLRRRGPCTFQSGRSSDFYAT
jgi:hypothetical protein